MTGLRLLRRYHPAYRRRRERLERALVRTRIAVAAELAGSTVDIDIPRGASVSARVKVEVYPGTHSRLALRPGARLREGTMLSFRGGAAEIGAGSVVRSNGTLNLTGRLIIGERVLLSTGVCIHCEEQVRIGDLSIVAEYTTIADVDHVRTSPGDPVHHKVRSEPVVIGENVWIGAHAVVTRGVTVGDLAFVGAGAIVTRDVPAGWLAAGNPARPVRDLMEQQPSTGGPPPTPTTTG